MTINEKYGQWRKLMKKPMDKPVVKEDQWYSINEMTMTEKEGKQKLNSEIMNEENDLKKMKGGRPIRKKPA